MKFHPTLIVFLIASNLIFSELALPSELNAHLIQVSPSSVKLELPYPSTSELQRYTINVNDEGRPENGFICHNFVRERAIKDKLFELHTKLEMRPRLEEMAIENKPEINVLDGSNYVSIALGFLAGAVLTIAVSKKLKN